MMYFRPSMLLVPTIGGEESLRHKQMRTVVYVGSGTEATSVNHG